MKRVSSPATVPFTSGQPEVSMAQATTLAALGLVWNVKLPPARLVERRRRRLLVAEGER